MKITILTIGSRGDVQPFIALGKGFNEAGYEVKIATHEEFRSFITSNGLNFHPVAGNPKEILESELGHAVTTTGRNPLSFLKSFKAAAESAMLPGFNDCLEASLDADYILCPYFVAISVGYNIAEYLNTPCCLTYLQPVTSTSTYPILMFPPWWKALGGIMNRFSYIFGEQMIWRVFSSIIDKWRREKLQLPSTSFWGPYKVLQAYPLLYGISPHVLPKAFDWFPNVHLTGYWFLDTPWEAPEELKTFLAEGPEPIYIGFGSMSDSQPEMLTELVIEALNKTGERGILMSGWGGLTPSDLPPHIYLADEAPHHWLFPQMKAVIHHGGAGTTGAGLRAGIPNIITPFFMDQPFWGQRIYDLKVGVHPIPHQKLSVNHLAKAISDSVENQALRKRAAYLGEKIRNENGVKTAIQIFQKYFGKL